MTLSIISKIPILASNFCISPIYKFDNATNLGQNVRYVLLSILNRENLGIQILI